MLSQNLGDCDCVGVVMESGAEGVAESMAKVYYFNNKYFFQN